MTGRAYELLLADDHLDAMRQIGDRAYDAPVAGYVQQAGRAEFGRLLGGLFRAPALPAEHPLVASLPEPSSLLLADRETIERGQRVFELYGPEVLLILGSYSLPLAYAAGNGVQVVWRARRLKDDPVRRLCDTAQMVINVMQPGGLEVGDVAWQSAKKVRLIHALIREQVRAEGSPWRPEWGTPINQEDLAGTLLTFSIAVLDALRRMGASISDEEGRAYIVAWSAIGELLGLDASLLPVSESEARLLAGRIGERQIRATPEGRELNAQLLASVETLFPVRGYATSLSRYFLEESVFGKGVVDVLGLPAPNWTRWLVTLRAAQKRNVLALLPHVPGGRWRRSWVARHVVQRMILWRRPDAVGAFAVPQRLTRSWQLKRQD